MKYYSKFKMTIRKVLILQIFPLNNYQIWEPSNMSSKKHFLKLKKLVQTLNLV